MKRKKKRPARESESSPRHAPAPNSAVSDDIEFPRDDLDRVRAAAAHSYDGKTVALCFGTIDFLEVTSSSNSHTCHSISLSVLVPCGSSSSTGACLHFALASHGLLSSPWMRNSTMRLSARLHCSVTLFSFRECGRVPSPSRSSM